MAVALNNLATVQEPDAGEHAYELLQESLLIRRGLGEKRTIAITLSNIGEICIERHQFNQARTALNEALALAIDIGMEGVIADVRVNLATIFWRDGDTETATSLLDDALARAERISDQDLMVRAQKLLFEMGRSERPGAPEHAAVAGGLTPRERELVTLIAQGLTDAEIARRLVISVRTVRSHLDRIRDKTGCRRRADLTRLAVQAGLA